MNKDNAVRQLFKANIPLQYKLSKELYKVWDNAVSDVVVCAPKFDNLNVQVVSPYWQSYVIGEAWLRQTTIRDGVVIALLRASNKTIGTGSGSI